jgi:hypothetical protein
MRASKALVSRCLPGLLFSLRPEHPSDPLICRPWRTEREPRRNMRIVSRVAGFRIQLRRMTLSRSRRNFCVIRGLIEHRIRLGSGIKRAVPARAKNRPDHKTDGGWNLRRRAWESPRRLNIMHKDPRSFSTFRILLPQQPINGVEMEWKKEEAERYMTTMSSYELASMHGRAIDALRRQSTCGIVTD